MSSTRHFEDASTRALVARCRQGNEDAWREFFDQHFEYVSRLARRFGIPDAELDDVCQDVFVVVHRKLGAFTYGKLSTWLYRITATVVASRHRRRRVRDRLWGMFGREDRVVRTPERAAEISEAKRLTQEVLARMPAAKREVFVLYELEGCSGQEIAQLAGIKVETVWTRLHYARRDFAEHARALGLINEEAGP